VVLINIAFHGGVPGVRLNDSQSVWIDETAQKAIAGLWPLEVGKEISFRKNFQPTDGKAKARIRVKSTKSVTIAGVTRHV